LRALLSEGSRGHGWRLVLVIKRCAALFRKSVVGGRMGSVLPAYDCFWDLPEEPDKMMLNSAYFPMLYFSTIMFQTFYISRLV
jgi:hypothetical protein